MCIFVQFINLIITIYYFQMSNYHKKLENTFRKLKRSNFPAKIVFIAMGLISTIWFLFRVIPKPQRAGYPCMRTAFPLMTGFLIWIGSITGAFTAFKLSGKYFKQKKVRVGIVLVIVGIGFSIVFFIQPNRNSVANTLMSNTEIIHLSNKPMGESWGINPGRVIWAWDKTATNENCLNTEADPFYASNNWDQSIVDEMITSSLLKLTSETIISNGWDALFKSFNSKKGLGDVGYTSGQTIFIKINEGTSSWLSNSSLERDYTKWKGNYEPVCETTPAVTMAILRQLVNNAGVPQENIWVADPRSHVWQHTYNYLSTEFPNVKYGDKNSSNESRGRTTLNINATATLTFSDLGNQMPNAIDENNWEEVVNADYLINLAALKAHARAGITLTAKNHFGSTTKSGAEHLHPGLVAEENDVPTRNDYGMYRVQVDLMGSSVLGQNTLLFLVDGLWGSPEAVKGPVKWQMAPFNNDWPNSIFISQDQVALESVCFDFLKTEANLGSYGDWKDRPLMAQGVDDYLQQAADPANWPTGISYDPDNSGTPLTSLGVHEHWNNMSNKQYSRNFGLSKGIELLSIPSELIMSHPNFIAKEANSIPVIDGIGDDACWKTTNWLPINQMWITWGDPMLPFDDFIGNFKVMWSSATNKLYFLVRTTDDVFVDGYNWPETSYPNYDILEIFIDEDQSGGPHVFDADGSLAANAFSYHLAIVEPADGYTSNSFVASDIAGTKWADRTTPNYANHFPEFVVRKEGRDYIWEFSMNVYSDAYNHNNATASLVELTIGKKMGLSLAYCDNDNPNENPLSRDNFVGSVFVPESAHNNHWKNADDFGVVTLVGSTNPVNQAPIITKPINSYTFPDDDTEYTIIANLNEFFNDEEGGSIIYNALAANTDISVRIEDSILYGTASPNFTGESYVTIFAIDDKEISTSQGFSIFIANRAPEATNTIDNQTITETGEIITVASNLDDLFADPDGDEITYTYETNNTELSVYNEAGALLIQPGDNFAGYALVTITASDGDLSTSITFNVNTTVGIETLSLKSILKIYPNPVVNNRFRITFNTNNYTGNKVKVRVLSMNGQVLITKSFTKEQSFFNQIIDTEGIASGIYLVEISVANQRIIREITK